MNNYNLKKLLSLTKKKSNEEIEKFIKQLLKAHELDSFDSSDITDMNNIYFDVESGKLTWKCFTHGFSSCYLWDIFKDNCKMLDNFYLTGCGYCECNM